MGKPNRRKLEKKRKAQRNRRREKPVSLAYHGKKYRTKELATPMLHAEIGIYETFVMTDRTITDHTVRRALEQLILGMRSDSMSALDETAEGEYIEGQEEDLLIWNVRRNWHDLFRTEPQPSRDQLIGVLRTILGSIEAWGSIDPASRGYLLYIEDFLAKLGVSVEVCSEDDERVAMFEQSSRHSTDAIEHVPGSPART